MQFPKFKEIYSELISTSSISSSDSRWDEGNQEVITKLANWLNHLGFDVRVDDVAPGKQNLIARKGEGEGGLLLSGHSDTVPFDQGRWDYDPHVLTEDDQRFYGLGTADMKGFFAFIIEAVRHTEWQKQQKPLYILATCDEETTMAGAQHFTRHTPYQPDYCIIGEPTSLIPVYAHKGHVANAIRVTGKSGHSSNPAFGVNAIEVMHEILFEMMKLRDRLIKDYHHPGFEIPSPTLNLGHIHGGDSANRICGCCELHYDVRPLPGMSLEGLEQLLRESLREVQAKWPGRIEMQPLHDSIPGYECKKDHPFVTEISQLAGHEAHSVNYCTEAPYLQQLCPTLVLGPGSIEQAHQPNEFLSFEYIDPTIRLLSQAIQKYCF
ncbi:acetylornithine deacetylase [Vibrio quintilis]|uniref:Acetylornithine deacetylase n=1 Tax=Vibrio quintilis TaxID=1117707 RepID=A0A1M7YYF6_9VIBR|nr:acetylornithine deacetylase [Vibrio quintilis]SHO57709.1 Acetylornithine deacetylase [Vibrio quintilis]